MDHIWTRRAVVMSSEALGVTDTAKDARDATYRPGGHIGETTYSTGAFSFGISGGDDSASETGLEDLILKAS